MKIKGFQKINNNNNLLLNKILVSLGILILIRIGTYIPIPGIEQSYINNYISANPTASFFNNLAGGGVFIIGVFTLNIFPYINASILMQLMITFIPNFKKLQKQDAETGDKQITKITKLISLGWALIQSIGISIFLKNILINWTLKLALEIVICLTMGSMVVMWLSEMITEYGIGNGTSLLIFTNIVSNFPNTFLINKYNFLLNFFILLLFFLAIAYIVILQEGLRIIPLTSSKQLSQNRRQFDLFTEIDSNYIPLRLNRAGVTPIIFTSSVLILPTYLINLGLISTIHVPIINYLGSIIYYLIYFLLILGFSYFYSTILLNPINISKDLNKMNISVKNIRTGASTTYYFNQTIKRITLIGGGLLGIIITLPNIIEPILNISSIKGLGPTSLLILVGATIDTIREIRSVILSNIYKNMVK
jgi:preprotein translocase subunit SecY